MTEAAFDTSKISLPLLDNVMKQVKPDTQRILAKLMADNVGTVGSGGEEGDDKPGSIILLQGDDKSKKAHSKPPATDKPPTTDKPDVPPSDDSEEPKAKDEEERKRRERVLRRLRSRITVRKTVVHGDVNINSGDGDILTHGSVKAENIGDRFGDNAVVAQANRNVGGHNVSQTNSGSITATGGGGRGVGDGTTAPIGEPLKPADGTTKPTTPDVAPAAVTTTPAKDLPKVDAAPTVGTVTEPKNDLDTAPIKKEETEPKGDRAKDPINPEPQVQAELNVNEALAVASLHDKRTNETLRLTQHYRADDPKKYKEKHNVLVRPAYFVGKIWHRAWQNNLNSGAFDQQAIRFINQLETTAKAVSGTDPTTPLYLTQDIVDKALVGGEELRKKKNVLQRVGFWFRDRVVDVTGLALRSEQILARDWMRTDPAAKTLIEERKATSLKEQSAVGENFSKLMKKNIVPTQIDLDQANRAVLSSELGETRFLIPEEMRTKVSEDLKALMIRYAGQNPTIASEGDLVKELNTYILTKVMPNLTPDQQAKLKGMELASNIIPLANKIKANWEAYNKPQEDKHNQTKLQELKIHLILGNNEEKDSVHGGRLGLNEKLARRLAEREITRKADSLVGNSVTYIKNLLADVGMYAATYAAGSALSVAITGTTSLFRGTFTLATGPIGGWISSSLLTGLKEGGLVIYGKNGELYGFGGKYLRDFAQAAREDVHGRVAPETKIREQMKKAMVDAKSVSELMTPVDTILTQFNNTELTKEKATELMYTLAHIKARIQMTDQLSKRGGRLKITIPQRFIQFTEGEDNRQMTELKGKLLDGMDKLAQNFPAMAMGTDFDKAVLIMRGQLSAGSQQEKVKKWLEKQGKDTATAQQLVTDFYSTINIADDKNLEAANATLSKLNGAKGRKAFMQTMIIAPIAGFVGQTAISEFSNIVTATQHGNMLDYFNDWGKFLSGNPQIHNVGGQLTTNLSFLQKGILMVHSALGPPSPIGFHDVLIDNVHVNLGAGLEYNTFQGKPYLMDIRTGDVKDLTGFHFAVTQVNGKDELGLFDVNGHLANMKQVLGADVHIAAGAARAIAGQGGGAETILNGQAAVDHWNKLSTPVDHKAWWTNNTKGSDFQELQLYDSKFQTQSGASGLIVDASHMGSARVGGSVIDVQKYVVEQKKLMFGLSLPGQKARLLIPEDADGVFDGKLAWNPDATNMVNVNGTQMSFGQLSRMVLNQDALKNFKSASEYGHTDILNLGDGKNMGHLEAGFMENGRWNILATIRGSGAVQAITGGGGGGDITSTVSSFSLYLDPLNIKLPPFELIPFYPRQNLTRSVVGQAPTDPTHSTTQTSSTHSQSPIPSEQRKSALDAKRENLRQLKQKAFNLEQEAIAKGKNKMNRAERKKLKEETEAAKKEIDKKVDEESKAIQALEADLKANPDKPKTDADAHKDHEAKKTDAEPLRDLTAEEKALYRADLDATVEQQYKNLAMEWYTNLKFLSEADQIKEAGTLGISIEDLKDPLKLPDILEKTLRSQISIENARKDAIRIKAIDEIQIKFAIPDLEQMTQAERDTCFSDALAEQKKFLAEYDASPNKNEDADRESKFQRAIFTHIEVIRKEYLRLAATLPKGSLDEEKKKAIYQQIAKDHPDFEVQAKESGLKGGITAYIQSAVKLSEEFEIGYIMKTKYVKQIKHLEAQLTALYAEADSKTDVPKKPSGRGIDTVESAGGAKDTMSLGSKEHVGHKFKAKDNNEYIMSSEFREWIKTKNFAENTLEVFPAFGLRPKTVSGDIISIGSYNINLGHLRSALRGELECNRWSSKEVTDGHAIRVVYIPLQTIDDKLIILKVDSELYGILKNKTLTQEELKDKNESRLNIEGATLPSKDGDTEFTRVEAVAAGRKYEITVASDFGGEREMDEDFLTVSTGKLSDLTFNMWAILDGMGGHEGGEIASKHGNQVLRKAMHNIKAKQVGNIFTFQDIDNITKSVNLALLEDPSAAEAEVQKIFEYVRREMRDSIATLKAANTRYEGGTTLAGVFEIGGQFYTFHCGDSRVYDKTSASLVQLTKDHGKVQRLIDEGKLTIETAQHHHEKNVIDRALLYPGGKDKEDAIDVKKITIGPSDTLFICCDGVSGAYDDDFTTKPHMNEALDKALLDANPAKALLKGARGYNPDTHGNTGDNISAIIIKPV